MSLRSARLALLAAAVPVAALVALDLLLSFLGWVPPDDPLLFFSRTHEARIDPFVSARKGYLEIRSDWVNDGLGLLGRRGKRAGRQFLLPGFRPTRVATPKSPGTLRVVALGGSTTYGLYVGADDAFPALLKSALAARAQGRRVEVINLGCPGFASDRVLGLLPRVLELEPDLVVVLTGHNEMLGGHVGPVSQLTPALRLRAKLLRSSTLFAWWNHLLAGTLRSAETQQVREEAAAVEAGYIPTYVPEEVPASARIAPDATFRARAAEGYGESIVAMAGLGRQAGVPMLFAVPAANLRWRPGIFAEAGLPPEFLPAFRAGSALLDAGDAAGALERIDVALAAAPDHAGAHFARGEALLALGRVDEARDAFRVAVDHDLRTHRITSALDAALLQALASVQAETVDLRPIFQERLDDATAEVLFVDHLHPTAEGHRRIAAALLPRVAERLGLE